MISLEWRPFSVDLASFKTWMDNEFAERSDGIVTTDTGIDVSIFDTVVDDVATVTTKWNSLTAEEEAVKLSRPQRLLSALANARNSILETPLWKDITTRERKVLIGIPLDFADEEWVLETYSP